MSEAENKDNSSNAGAPTDPAPSNRDKGLDDSNGGSGLRSANAGGSSQDATNVSNAGVPAAATVTTATTAVPTKEVDMKSQ